jgi:tight adherence protein C
MTTQFALVLTLGGGAALVAVLVWLVLPDFLPERPRHGARAARLLEALAASALFRLIEPPVRALAHHAQGLRLGSWRDKTAARLVQAGEPLGLSADEFAGLCAFGVLAGALVGMPVAPRVGLAVVPVFALLGGLYPNTWLEDRAARRLAAISRGLPYANDLLVLAMEAGADFIGAIRHFTGRNRDGRDPVRQEFARILHDLELGSTRRQALESFSERCPTEPVKGFVTSVVQAERRGTPVAAALRIQSTALRVHRSLLVEKLASRAAVFILLPLLFIFAATILVLFGGLIVRAMRGEML